jgi:hypothetical protein
MYHKSVGQGFFKNRSPTLARSCTMKNHLIVLICIIIVIGCSPSKKELYERTDAFVHSLATTYESYGLLGGSSHSRTTSDGLYKITPIGRLINVRIQKAVSDEEYEELREDLENHYKGDDRVNRVYICQAGTVMIDCRN